MPCTFCTKIYPILCIHSKFVQYFGYYCARDYFLLAICVPYILYCIFVSNDEGNYVENTRFNCSVIMIYEQSFVVACQTCTFKILFYPKLWFNMEKCKTFNHQNMMNLFQLKNGKLKDNLENLTSFQP